MIVAADVPVIDDFKWPQGKRAAISLSFDDARASQLDRGVPLFDAFGVKATFYIVPDAAAARIDDWRSATACGHELGNHSMTHPCSGSYSFARRNGLEEYSLERMARQLDEASRRIAQDYGAPPRTYAYTCGHQFVGRGRNVTSYVPLVAERFVVGRGWLDSHSNPPGYVDLARANGCACDALSFDELSRLINEAVEQGTWLLLAGHDIGTGQGWQITFENTLERICEFATNPDNGIWIATVAEIGEYIAQQRINRASTA